MVNIYSQNTTLPEKKISWTKTLDSFRNLHKYKTLTRRAQRQGRCEGKKTPIYLNTGLHSFYNPLTSLTHIKSKVIRKEAGKVLSGQYIM